MFAEFEEETSGSISVIEQTEEELDQGDGKGDRFAHYVSKKIDATVLPGSTVVALCGKVWRPKYNPKNFPICPVCKELYNKYSDFGSKPNWPFG